MKDEGCRSFDLAPFMTFLVSFYSLSLLFKVRVSALYGEDLSLFSPKFGVALYSG